MTGPLSAAWQMDGNPSPSAPMVALPKKIMAIGCAGVWEDIGGAGEKQTAGYYLSKGTSQKTDGRRWMANMAGLYAVDDAGKIVKSLRACEQNYQSSSGFTAVSGSGIWLRADMPLIGLDRYGSMCSDGQNLFLYMDGQVPYGPRDMMLCYEPSADTWYGPIKLAQTPWMAIGAAGGMWVGNVIGLGFMSTAEIKAAALAADRVTTSADLKNRQERLYKALPPMKLAMYYLAKKDLAQVSSLLEPILKATPENPEALLMMGFVTERLANEPQKAIEWYERLAAIKGNQSARLTGMLAVFTVKYGLQQYSQVVDLARQIEKEFPSVDLGGGRNFNYQQTLENAKRHLQQSAPATLPGPD